MADNRKFVQAQKFTLAGSGCSATATSINVVSFKHIVAVGSTNITMTDFGTVGFGTLEPGTSREELISFTGVTQNGDGTATLTGVTRNLKSYAPYDQYSATGLAHTGGASFVVSNNPGFYNTFTNKENDETITGVWVFDAANPPRLTASTAPDEDVELTNKKYVDDQNALDVKLTGNQTIAGVKTFSSFPVTPSSAPTTDYQVANKKYADDLAIAGSPDASTTVKGIVEEATQAEYDARTATGGTGARLFVNPSIQRGILYHDYAADAGATDSYAITVTPAPAAYTTGDVYTFRANTANTGVATLNVNSLGAKTIKKNSTSDLDNSDILAGQIVTVCYDGTNMQLVAPVYVQKVTTGIASKNLADASGTQTIAHGLGTIPKSVVFSCTATTVGEMGVFNGVFTASSQVSTHSVYNDAGTEFSGNSTTAGFRLFATNNAANFQEGTVTVDATNINIAWVKNGSPAVTYSFIWIAEA